MPLDLVPARFPLPPSTNRIWRYVGGRAIISADAREYRTVVREVVRRNWPNVRLFGRVSVSIIAFMRLRRDIDNVIKPLLDGLQHAGLFQSDNQVDRLWVSRGAKMDADGYLAVRVSEIG